MDKNRQSPWLLAGILSIIWISGTSAQNVELPVPNGQEQTFEVYLTGYSFWDNTPPGTVMISHPRMHSYAAGSGTYDDPVSLAVGHKFVSGANMLDFPAGTMFYLPRLRKYTLVEDTCGDGAHPENGPCHIGYQGRPWIDIYVDGEQVGREESDTCMYKITDIQPAIMDPKPDYPVFEGPISESGCEVFPDP